MQHNGRRERQSRELSEIITRAVSEDVKSLAHMDHAEGNNLLDPPCNVIVALSTHVNVLFIKMRTIYDIYQQG